MLHSCLRQLCCTVARHTERGWSSPFSVEGPQNHHVAHARMYRHNTYMYIHNTYMYIRMHTHTTHTHAHTHTRTDTPHTHTDIHTRIHTHIRTQTNTHTHVHTHARTHARTRARTHARTHARAHARTPTCVVPLTLAKRGGRAGSGPNRPDLGVLPFSFLPDSP